MMRQLLAVRYSSGKHKERRTETIDQIVGVIKSNPKADVESLFRLLKKEE